MLRIEIMNNGIKMYEIAKPFMNKGQVTEKGLNELKKFLLSLPTDEREDAIDGFVMICIAEGDINE